MAGEGFRAGGLLYRVEGSGSGSSIQHFSGLLQGSQRFSRSGLYYKRSDSHSQLVNGICLSFTIL